MQLSSGFTFGDDATFSGTSCPVPLWVSLMVALSVSRMCRNRDRAFSAVACCALSRTCCFLSHPSLCMAQGGIFCSLVHIELRVKTPHLGTVSVCLASLVPRRA